MLTMHQMNKQIATAHNIFQQITHSARLRLQLQLQLQNNNTQSTATLRMLFRTAVAALLLLSSTTANGAVAPVVNKESRILSDNKLSLMPSAAPSAVSLALPSALASATPSAADTAGGDHCALQDDGSLSSSGAPSISYRLYQP